MTIARALASSRRALSRRCAECGEPILLDWGEDAVSPNKGACKGLEFHERCYSAQKHALVVPKANAEREARVAALRAAHGAKLAEFDAGWGAKMRALRRSCRDAHALLPAPAA